MFDANMRHLPKGLEFFCDVWSCKEHTVLYKAGVRKNDLLMAEMLDDDDKNPRVMFYVNGEWIVVKSAEYSRKDWYMVYLGKADFTDFVYKKDLLRAKAAYSREAFRPISEVRENRNLGKFNKPVGERSFKTI